MHFQQSHIHWQWGLEVSSPLQPPPARTRAALLPWLHLHAQRQRSCRGGNRSRRLCRCCSRRRAGGERRWSAFGALAEGGSSSSQSPWDIPLPSLSPLPSSSPLPPMACECGRQSPLGSSRLRPRVGVSGCRVLVIGRRGRRERARYARKGVQAQCEKPCCLRTFVWRHVFAPKVGPAEASSDEFFQLKSSSQPATSRAPREWTPNKRGKSLG